MRGEVTWSQNGHKTSPKAPDLAGLLGRRGRENSRTYAVFPDCLGRAGWLVAHRGFEPLISALRGRCPRPLDECATYQPWIIATGVQIVHVIFFAKSVGPKTSHCKPITPGR